MFSQQDIINSKALPAKLIGEFLDLPAQANEQSSEAVVSMTDWKCMQVNPQTMQGSFREASFERQISARKLLVVGFQEYRHP